VKDVDLLERLAGDDFVAHGDAVCRQLFPSLTVASARRPRDGGSAAGGV
jgi:hypothetical protein